MAEYWITAELEAFNLIIKKPLKAKCQYKIGSADLYQIIKSIKSKAHNHVQYGWSWCWWWW